MEHILAGNFAFEKLDPSTVLPRHEWYYTRSKFARGDWDYRNANLKLSDGETPVGKTRFYSSWFTNYLRPHRELTADYREALIESGENDIEFNGKIYRPARLDEKPDLVVSWTGHYNDSDNIVSSPERQLSLARTFDFYCKRGDEV